MQQYYKLKFNWRDENIKIPSYCNNRIDVIWTFVNGSEQNWIESYEKNLHIKVEKTRYRDYGSLKYSMRAMEANNPTDIHWHLIVQDEHQIPSFLDKSKLIYYNDESTPGSLRIIYHKDYFPDPSVLPVFNSNAIEAAMFNLEGIGECVMYLNDDFFVNSPLNPSIIFDENGKMKTYFFQGTVLDQGKGSYYDKANANANEMLNWYYNENLKRNRAAHHWSIFRMSVLKKGGKIFHEQLFKSTRNKLRADNDVGFYSFINNFMVREGYSVPYFEHTKIMKYYCLKNKDSPTSAGLRDLKRRKHPFLCINDCLKADDPEEMERGINAFVSSFENVYPNKTPFEL